MRLSSLVFIICIGLSVPLAVGQSLSIIKKSDNAYWIEASAPPDKPSTLQTSANMHSWYDLKADVQGQYSYRIDSNGTSTRFFRLTPQPPAPEPIRIVMLGDSMTADCCGWGQGMYGYFKPSATIVNYATAWMSTKLFLRSAELDKMLVVEPNYVLIQFGFVDQGWGADLAPDRYTTLEEFDANLREIVKTVRGFNGIPILITLHSARIWDENGKVIPTWKDRNDVTKAVAADTESPLIDLNQLSMDLFNELGPDCCDFMQWAGGGPEDRMHVSPLGAQYIANLVVKALPDSLAPYLTGVFDPLPKP